MPRGSKDTFTDKQKRQTGPARKAVEAAGREWLRTGILGSEKLPDYLATKGAINAFTRR